jgi:hypothetical protein
MCGLQAPIAWGAEGRITATISKKGLGLHRPRVRVASHRGSLSAIRVLVYRPLGSQIELIDAHLQRSSYHLGRELRGPEPARGLNVIDNDINEAARCWRREWHVGVIYTGSSW